MRVPIVLFVVKTGPRVVVATLENGPGLADTGQMLQLYLFEPSNGNSLFPLS